MVSYKLTYFNGKGKGELIRLAFAFAGQEFEDERIAREEWPNLKPNMPLKQMPVLTVTEEGKQTVYCQSDAIAKFIAKKFGFFGSNAYEELLVDEMCGSLNDVMDGMRKVIFVKSDQDKQEANTKLTDEVVPKFVEYVKKRRAQFGENGFLIGPKITLADIALYNIVDAARTRGLPTLWEKYTEITDIATRVESDEKIAAYLAKRPVTTF